MKVETTSEQPTMTIKPGKGGSLDSLRGGLEDLGVTEGKRKGGKPAVEIVRDGPTGGEKKTTGMERQPLERAAR